MLTVSKGSIPKKMQNFGHMSKLGLPYVPCTLIWTKKSLDNYSSVYPTYLPKKFGHFGIQICFFSNFPHFVRNSINHNFWKQSLTKMTDTTCVSSFLEVFFWVMNYWDLALYGPPMFLKCSTMCLCSRLWSQKLHH